MTHYKFSFSNFERKGGTHQVFCHIQPRNLDQHKAQHSLQAVSSQTEIKAKTAITSIYPQDVTIGAFSNSIFLSVA